MKPRYAPRHRPSETTIPCALLLRKMPILIHHVYPYQYMKRVRQLCVLCVLVFSVFSTVIGS